MDNGAGRVVVELARALAGREDELATRVEFVAFGAEEVGLVGSNRLAGETTLDDVTAVLNFDGVVQGRTLKCSPTASTNLNAAAEDVADQLTTPSLSFPNWFRTATTGRSRSGVCRAI